MAFHSSDDAVALPVERMGTELHSSIGATELHSSIGAVPNFGATSRRFLRSARRRFFLLLAKCL